MIDGKLLGIPYKYGGCDYDGCDCWGIASLYYRSQLNFDVDVQDFYGLWPDHPRGNNKSQAIKYAMNLVKINGFGRSLTLKPHSLLLGHGDSTFSFAVWTGTKVLICGKSMCSRLVDWETWKSGYNAVTIYSVPSSVLSNPRAA